jgi:hypothetical protein
MSDEVVSSIAPDGCHIPPIEGRPVPEPDPTSIYEDYDWRVHPHWELYSMVHDDLNVEVAHDVARLWSSVAEKLAQIGTDLQATAEATAQAWEGSAAELARETVMGLSRWSVEAGELATDAGSCVEDQARNAAAVRAEVPPEAVMPMAANGAPSTGAVPGGDSMSTFANSFNGGDFGSASLITADQGAMAAEVQAAHDRAAEALQRFQQRSGEVYATVPQFAPPKPLPAPGGGTGPPPASPPPPPNPPGGPETLGGHGAPVPGGAPGGGAPAVDPPHGPGQPEPGARTGAVPGRLGSGPGAGGAVAGNPARPAATPAGGTSGGLPLGIGANREEDLEHKSPSYLEEDEDIWGVLPEVAPPVIGE